ncbi:MAG: nitroreductase family protein [Robiginitomaculum sp.]|nr:nitroreductase family protein [Robiginitomaculum sp.]MDQ7077678.1 nitroreductase family protein [Robiginitomaculum sp.]
MEERARAFYEDMRSRRTVRDFSNEAIPQKIIEYAIRTAGSAPSGANKQPWFFVAINDSKTKAQIRVAAEKEEKAFYAGKAGEEWLRDLEHLGTNEHKPFLETAPWLIVVFQQNYSLDPDTGKRRKNYYIHESVGLACGLLIASLHHAGLATLTHTPSPMNFLRDLLDRPKNERAVMIIVAGYPDDHAMVPDITRKALEEIAEFK